MNFFQVEVTQMFISNPYLLEFYLFLQIILAYLVPN